MNQSEFHISPARTTHIPNSQRLVPFGLIVWAAVAALFVLTDIASPFRPVVVLSFLMLAPGVAVVRLLRLENFLLQASLAIGLALALDAVASTFLLYISSWSFELVFLSISGLTVLCALVDLIQEHKQMGNAQPL